MVPKRHKNPDKSFTKKRKEMAIIGTPKEHVEEENQIRKRSSTESVTTQVTYNGPLYTYRSAEGASNGDVQERESPINTGWSNDLNYNTASEIRDVFQATMDWNQPIPTDIQNSTRYVNISDSDGTFKQRSSSAEAMDEIDTTKQWHVRLYNIGDYKYSNHSVVGQAHVDPYDHGLRKYLHLLPYVNDLSVNWYFDKARERVLDDWGYNGFSYTRNNVGNDNFDSDDSHNGEIGLISN